MKKILMTAVLALACAAQAEFKWSWWPGTPNLSKKEMKGCVLGVASEVDTVTGAQVDLLWHKAKKIEGGCQYAIGYSRADTVRNGVQCGIYSAADKAALQFGLICANKGGFLPVFVFFNFDKTMFGPAK